MPNWKKLVVSGSDAALNSLNVTTSITGSTAQLTNIANAGTDTDKFLVLDSSDNVDFRTGTQVLSDIGGQASLTNPVTGTGTTNYLPKFTGTSALGNSLIFDDGTDVGIGTATPASKLDINGDLKIGTGTGNDTISSPSVILARFNNTTYDHTYGPITANPASYDFTFQGNDIHYGNITTGYIPQQDSIGMSDSPIQSDSTNVSIGYPAFGSIPEALSVLGNVSASGDFIANGSITGSDILIDAWGSVSASLAAAGGVTINNNTDNYLLTATGTANTINGESGLLFDGTDLDLTGGDFTIQNVLLSNQQNTDVDTGTETVAEISSTTYTAAFFDYVIKNGTNLRAGIVSACHDGSSNVEYNEVSTNDLGDTSDVTLSVDISGGNIRL